MNSPCHPCPECPRPCQRRSRCFPPLHRWRRTPNASPPSSTTSSSRAAPPSHLPSPVHPSPLHLQVEPRWTPSEQKDLAEQAESGIRLPTIDGKTSKAVRCQMQRLQLTEPPQVPFPTAVEDHDDVHPPFLHLNYDSWTLNHLLANFCLPARCVSFYQIVCLSVSVLGRSKRGTPPR